MFHDKPERDVVRSWRRSLLSSGSVLLDLQWVRRFRSYCQRSRLEETSELTLDGAMRFAHAYTGPRTMGPVGVSSCLVARRALHAWACTLHALGSRSRSGARSAVRPDCRRCWVSTVVLAFLIVVSRMQRFSVTSRLRRVSLPFCGAGASPPVGQRSLTSTRSSRIWGRVFLSELRPIVVVLYDLSCASSARRVGYVTIWQHVWWLLESEGRSNHRVHCRGQRCAESSG